MGKVSNTSDNHSHSNQPLDIADLDAAQKSLADALKVSFLILKVIMLLLAVYYVFISGLYKVEQNEKAVRLRYGRIIEQNIMPGLHMAWPYPVEQVVRIRTAPETIELKTQFWFQPDPNAPMQLENEMRGRPGPLNPSMDGYVVTGDMNIVHAQWSVTYEIENTADYITNVGDKESMAVKVVRSAVEQAIVRTAAQLTGDVLIDGYGYKELAMDYAQANLDALGSGIRVNRISQSDRAIPASVYPAYVEVTNAESDKGKAIDQAEKEREQILRETAGGGYEALWQLITAYERALDLEDKQAADQLSSQLDKAFRLLEIDTEERTVFVSGRAAAIIDAAKTYRTQVVEEVNAHANTFNRLLPEYQKNPRIVMGRMWQDAKEMILTGKAYRISPGQMPGKVETLYLPKDAQLRILTNRDPQVAKRQEELMLMLQEQARRKAQPR